MYKLSYVLMGIFIGEGMFLKGLYITNTPTRQLNMVEGIIILIVILKFGLCPEFDF